MIESQTPAQGILLQHEFSDSYYYHIPCTCGNPDDVLDFSIEIDTEIDEVILSIETKQKTDWYSTSVDLNPWKYNNSTIADFLYFVQSFIDGVFRRIKLTKDIWVHGYAEYHHTTIMDKQTAINFANTIVSGFEKIESLRENKNAN